MVNIVLCYVGFFGHDKKENVQFLIAITKLSLNLDSLLFPRLNFAFCLQYFGSVAIKMDFQEAK